MQTNGRGGGQATSRTHVERPAAIGGDGHAVVGVADDDELGHATVHEAVDALRRPDHQVRTRNTPLVGVTMLQPLASLKPALSVPEHCARLFAGSDAAMVIRFG